MKLHPANNSARRRAGLSLIECLVYYVVFSLLMAGGTTAFLFCWYHARAVIFTSNEISDALRAGEVWRADVRSATGTISVDDAAGSETVKIPANGKVIVYRFNGGQLLRETEAQNNSRVLLDKVAVSQIKSVPGDGVAAWRWQLELQPRHKEITFPLRFYFAAASTRL